MKNPYSMNKNLRARTRGRYWDNADV